MTALRIARLGLLGSLAAYGLAFAIGTAAPGAGLLVGLFAMMSMAVTALACVAIQLVQLITSCLKPVEKPD
jgi:hypothetical protein